MRLEQMTGEQALELAKAHARAQRDNSSHGREE
jgi:hypothetical protein